MWVFVAGVYRRLSHLIQKKYVNNCVSLLSIHFQTARQTIRIAAENTEFAGLLINLRADENQNKYVSFRSIFLSYANCCESESALERDLSLPQLKEAC